MMTFRPGQKVRIKDSVTPRHYPEVGDSFDGDMLKYKGKVYTISSTDGGRIRLKGVNRWNWYGIWFEPVYTIIHTKAIK